MFSDLYVGYSDQFERTVTSAMIVRFAKLSGDMNPLHICNDYAKRTEFKKPVAHGMLTASFFSALVGMLLPGEKALYLSQEIRFRRPVFARDRLTVSGKVIAMNDSLNLLEIETAIRRKGNIVVSGIAKVKMRTT